MIVEWVMATIVGLALLVGQPIRNTLHKVKNEAPPPCGAAAGSCNQVLAASGSSSTISLNLFPDQRAELVGRLPSVDCCWTSPELRTRQTAEALGLSANVQPMSTRKAPGTLATPPPRKICWQIKYHFDGVARRQSVVDVSPKQPSHGDPPFGNFHIEHTATSELDPAKLFRPPRN